MSNYQEAFLGRLLRDCHRHPAATHSASGCVLLYSIGGVHHVLLGGFVLVYALIERNLCFFTRQEVVSVRHAGTDTCGCCHVQQPYWKCRSGLLCMISVSRQNLIVNRDDSLAHFLLWLLSNNHWSVFLVTLHFAHSQYL